MANIRTHIKLFKYDAVQKDMVPVAYVPIQVVLVDLTEKIVKGKKYLQFAWAVSPTITGGKPTPKWFLLKTDVEQLLI